MRFLPYLFAVSFFCCGCEKKTEQSTEPLILKAQKFVRKVLARGEVFPERESALSCPMQLNGMIDFMIAPGSTVQKGDVVIKISAKQMEDRLKAAAKKLQYELRKLDRVRKEVEKEKLQLDLKVLEKEFAFRLNQIEVEKSLGEKDPRVIQNMNLKILLLQDKVSLLRTRLESFEVLDINRTISTTEMEQLRKNLEVSKLKVQLEKVTKKEAVTGATGEEKEKLLLEQQIMAQEWETAREERKEKLKSLPLKIQKGSLVVQKHQNEIKKLNSILSQATIRSTEDGVFLQTKHPWNGTVITEGSEVRRRMRIGRIVDFQSLQVRLRVPEEHADLVSPGNLVNMETISGTALSGTILKIQSMATPYNPTDSQSGRFHWAFVSLNDAPSLMAGESVKASIIVNTYENIFKIPREGAAKIMGQQLEIATPSGSIVFPEFQDIGDFLIAPASSDSIEVLLAYH